MVNRQTTQAEGSLAVEGSEAGAQWRPVGRRAAVEECPWEEEPQ